VSTPQALDDSLPGIAQAAIQNPRTHRAAAPFLERAALALQQLQRAAERRAQLGDVV